MLSKADIRALAEADADPAVYIYLPVHPALPERRKNAIRLRNLMRQAEEGLSARGADPDRLLVQARRALDPEPPIEGRNTQGLAIFIALHRLKQSIDVGPMCGESNVIYWLTEHGHDPERPLVEHLFGLAKRREANFTDAELEEAVRTFRESSSRAGARG